MSPDAPAVSVVIPCHDAAAHLEETLASVYSQRFSDWELVVVDDGSTDASTDILRRHADRLRTIRQENRGPGVARQRGFGEARGRYIQYLDADDLLLPDALATRVEALARSGADVAYADWQRLRQSDDGRWIGGETVARRIEDVHRDPELACFRGFWSPPAALLYARAICERVAWHASLRTGEDARYLFDAAAAGARFVHVAGVSARYREHPGSLSRRDDVAFLADVQRNADEVQARWEARGGLSEDRIAALRACFGYVARGAFRRDPALFRSSAARLAALGGRSPWITAATLLERSVGRRAALAVLRLLGRPAP